MKRILSVFLVVTLIMGMSLSVSAAPAQTFKEKVNAMELEPLKPSYWSAAFIKRVETSVKGKKTNYEKLVAVYDYVRTNATDKKMLNGYVSGYAVQLQCALEVVGFRTYYITGKLASKGDWSHQWVGIDIGKHLYYFDAALPALSGTETKKCFGISYQNAPLYKDATIYQMEISPTVNKSGAMFRALADADGVPNSVAKRSPYRSVSDRCHPPSLYYAANNGYWLMTDDTETPILDTDKNGVQYIFYPDGTRKEYRKAS